MVGLQFGSPSKILLLRESPTLPRSYVTIRLYSCVQALVIHFGGWPVLFCLEFRSSCKTSVRSGGELRIELDVAIYFFEFA